jgi:hypothetical protein
LLLLLLLDLLMLQQLLLLRLWLLLLEQLHLVYKLLGPLAVRGTNGAHASEHHRNHERWYTAS